MMRCDESEGWIEIGKRCSAGRRSVWARVHYDTDDEPEPDDLLERLKLSARSKIVAIELSAGREGDDAYVKITPDNPQWGAIRELITTALFAATT